MVQQVQQQLGPLRSEITFTLHTQYATRLWQGRFATRDKDGKVLQSAIIGIPMCLSLISQIQTDAANDDPYADDFLIKLEQHLMTSGEEMKNITHRLLEIYVEHLPENFDIERCANISPMTYPIRINSQLGYRLLFLLGDFDTLARSVMTAAHIAIMTREEAREWLEAGAKLVRQSFGIIEHYKHSGITRRDAVENNANYAAAVKRMGYEVQPEILTGKLRANFAPEIRHSELDLDEPNQVVE